MNRYVFNRPPCAACTGRGWRLLGVKGKDWPGPCDTCLGCGKAPTLYRLARHLNEEPKALYRLDRMEAGPALARRLFRKLTKFIAARPELAA